MNSGQACRTCRGLCSLIPGRGCFDDLLGDEIIVSPLSPVVEPLKLLETKSGQILVSISAVEQVIYAPDRFWERGTHCFVGRFFVWAPDGTRECSVVWRMDDSESSSCKRGTGESFTPCVLRSIAVSPQSGWFENAMPSTTERGYLSYGDERISGSAMERRA